jgi:hypothetical protein
MDWPLGCVGALSPPAPLSQNYLGEGGGKSFRPMRIRRKSTAILTRRRGDAEARRRGGAEKSGRKENGGG